VTDEFRRWLLPAADHPFEQLLGSVRFDDVTTGRRGTVLVKVDPSGIPIVRTTTPYRAPAQPFRPIHDRLAEEIRECASSSHPFNNALVEHYTSAYSTMKRHSDQALDLAEASSRRLIVKPKESGAVFDIPLDHGGVVAFSLDTNRRFSHAIALRANAPDTEWFGITFRTSKTFVRFVDGHPILPSGVRLTFASEEQRRELFKMRRRENDETSFAYPSISYTLSQSDLFPPESW
jgi:hypothetical protein